MERFRSGFYVMVTGQVDGVKMTGGDNLYCKYSFNYGMDWTAIHGLEHGISQISRKSSGEHQDVYTWNYPLDITFRTTNVHGWPQLVLSVYGINLMGKDVIRGYGCTHVPVTPGRHVRYVRLYTPVSSSWCQQLVAWLTGNPAEFFDAKFVAQGHGREVTRVKSRGTVKVVFNVSTKNMSQWNYRVSSERDVGHLSDDESFEQRDMEATPTPKLRQRNKKKKLKAKESVSESSDTDVPVKGKVKKKKVPKKKKKAVVTSESEVTEEPEQEKRSADGSKKVKAS